MGKGKSVNYHTEITTTKKEQIIIWVTFLAYLSWFLISFLIIKSVWLMVLLDFIGFAIMFGIFLLIIFSPHHKAERLNNTFKTK